MEGRSVRVRGLLLASVLLCLAGCSRTVDQETLAAWGLPRDLPEHLAEIESLKLPPAVDRVDWLPDHLRSVDLSGGVATDLPDLPGELRALNVRYLAGLSSLETLPPRLHTLDVRWTGIEDLGTLGRSSDGGASGLRVLRAGGAGLRRIGNLPEGLTTLELVDVSFEDGSALPRGLRELHLAGPEVVGLRSLPPRLTVLSLDRVRAGDLLDLPRSVTSLHVRDTAVNLDHLPPFLTELSWTVPRTKVSGSLPRSLRRLRVTSLGERPVSRGDIPALPRALEHLAVTSAAADLFAEIELPPNLRSLDLSGFRGESLAFDLPDSLEELSLAYSDLQDLPELPAGLRVLDLSGVSTELLGQIGEDGLPEQLERLTLQGLVGSLPFALEDSIQCLDLSGSPGLRELPDLPGSLVHLDVRSTGLTGLPALPGSLRSIDLGSTALSSLAGLPESVEEVVADAGQLQSLAGLPPAVRILRFEASRDWTGGDPDAVTMRAP